MNDSPSRYEKSLRQLSKAEEVIPLGAQTVSKSRLTFPAGLAPLYGSRAEGCRIWDVDGNEYIDLVSALAAVNIGYGDQDVTAAVTEQIPLGVTISLSHPLEEVVARQLVELIPSAEMVRFAKNGSDATSAAIRVARGFTGRDHVITCGYHGWHDWYIGNTPSRNLGVPEDVSRLSHPVPFNNLTAMEEELKARPTAAIIMEVMTTDWPAEGYLEGVRRLATEYGAVLIFDEMVTGFRFAKGGAQEFFGVTPDLSTFGKGIANGFPLSAIVGRADLMAVLETAFFTGTFGGELLSLTAAHVILRKVKETNAIATISEVGQDLADHVSSVIEELEMSNHLWLQGHPSWKFLMWNPALGDLLPDLKLLFMQEMCKNGVLMIATHNVTAAMDSSSNAKVVDAYAKTLPVIKAAIDSKDARSRLEAEVGEMGPRVR